MRELLRKYKEIISYLFFGVLTTVVGWAVYFAVLLFGKAACGIPAEVTSGAKYLAVYTAAQVIQWIAAVLFAYFTNRAWVFTSADKEAKILPQLTKFAGGRLLTFGVDFLVTYFGALLLSAMIPAWSSAEIFGRTLNLNEIGAKVTAAVIVIISNYFISKLFVFKEKKGE
ncbi:MAG: GtrA family protein [Clostridia bacterium]|nr:GtrA family protein [Clostridia bacterium]